MGKVAADHGVAEIAVGHLVDIDGIQQVGPLRGQPRVDHIALAPADQRDVLHRPRHSGRRPLVVLGERERRGKLLRHPRQHLLGAAKAVFEIFGRMLGAAEIGDRDRLLTVMEFPIVVAHKLADGKADQIGGAALVEPVVGRLGAVAVVGVGDMIAIGKDREAAVRTQADIQAPSARWAGRCRAASGAPARSHGR